MGGTLARSSGPRNPKEGAFASVHEFEFASQVAYDLTTVSTSGGSVTTPGEGAYNYAEGSVVDIIATPDSGYGFVNWTGDTSTIADINDPTTTITMNDDYSITANFSQIMHALTMQVSGSGSTTPTVDIYSYGEGTIIDITAMP